MSGEASEAASYEDLSASLLVLEERVLNVFADNWMRHPHIMLQQEAVKAAVFQVFRDAHARLDRAMLNDALTEVMRVAHNHMQDVLREVFG